MERCRLCSLSGTKISTMKIFDEEGILLKLRERILNRLQIVIYEYDLLPKIICRVCYGELEKYESFIGNAQKTQEILLKEIQRDTAVSEKSVTREEIKQEPITLEENSESEAVTDDVVQEIIETPTKDDLQMMEFVEVNSFVKFEHPECLNDIDVFDDGSISDQEDEQVRSSLTDERRVLKTQLPNMPRCPETSRNALVRARTESICVEEDSLSEDTGLEEGNQITTNDHDRNSLNSEFDPDDISFDGEYNARNKSQPQSWERYEQEYLKFTRWKTENHCRGSSPENVFLAYFKELATTKAPTTQWAVYSMLKSTLQKKERINIDNYSEVRSFLRNNSKNYSPKPKQTVMFTYKNLEDYYSQANDDEYLFQKVVMIFSVYGATCQELVQLTVDEIKLYHNEETKQSVFVVTIPKEKTKTKKYPHQLMINRSDYFETVKKYRDLRSKKILTDRFFIRYDRKRKRCINQAVGIHTFSSIPKQIAKFLQLPDPETYNGHSFKRLTLATNSANVGKRFIDLKNHRTMSLITSGDQCPEDSLFLTIHRRNFSRSSSRKNGKTALLRRCREANLNIFNVSDEEYMPPCKRSVD